MEFGKIRLYVITTNFSFNSKIILEIRKFLQLGYNCLLKTWIYKHLYKFRHLGKKQGFLRLLLSSFSGLINFLKKVLKLLFFTLQGYILRLFQLSSFILLYF